MEFHDVGGVGQVSKTSPGAQRCESRNRGCQDDDAAGPARDTVVCARALGVTLSDTAEFYGFGKCERFLGDAPGGDRTGMAVASKMSPVTPVPALVNQRAQASAQPAAGIELSEQAHKALTATTRAYIAAPGARVLTDPVEEKSGRR